MALRLNMSGTSHKVVVTNKHDIFKDSELREGNFTVYGRTLTGVERARIERGTISVDKRGKVDVDSNQMLIERFNLMVTGWEGFTQEDPNEPNTDIAVECNEENKRIIALEERDFARLIINAIEEEDEKTRVVKEAAEKN